jgi:fructose-1,6-bisphosphatase/inositol monophosphatase family enzyme
MLKVISRKIVKKTLDLIQKMSEVEEDEDEDEDEDEVDEGDKKVED